TRRYHGLLVAALQPPVGRRVLLAQLAETLWTGPVPFDLSTNEFPDGTIHPQGYRHLANFDVEMGVPTWQFQFQDWLLERKVWMEQGENTTFIRYLLHSASTACRLQLRPLCAHRDVHALQAA